MTEAVRTPGISLDRDLLSNAGSFEFLYVQVPAKREARRQEFVKWSLRQQLPPNRRGPPLKLIIFPWRVTDSNEYTSLCYERGDHNHISYRST